MSQLCLGCMEHYDSDLDICPQCGYCNEDPVDEALHLEPGAHLKDGTYLVGKVLGFGGFGVTYVAYNTVLEQRVAIKEYLPSEFSTRMPGQSEVTVFNGDKAEQYHDGVVKFVDEARRLAQFQNTDGIVRIFDTFEENNTAYIIMEYLEGQTLTQYLETSGPLTGDEAVRLLTPVMQSLAAVHEKGIIHRDIAPDNIMVTTDGQVKLIDFGAARYATTSHSRSLTVIIKPGYSPEEQYRSRGDQGPWTDVYAIGATLYRMTTGQVPPDAMERRAFFEGKQKDILTVPGKYTKDISENQETAILNAMNVRIEDRTPDMLVLEEELTSEEPVKRRAGKIRKIDVLKWPLWARITIPAAAAAVIAVLALFFTGIIGFNANLAEAVVIPDGYARVPAVTNNDLPVAEQRLIESELSYSIIGKEYSSEIPAGLVLTQEIQPGSIVALNSVVELVISGGAEQDLSWRDPDGNYSLADTVFRTLEEAQAMLAQQEIIVEVTEEDSDTVAPGVVISQDPPPGTALKPGSTVHLVVSRGGRPFAMPNVVGLSEAEAKGVLAQAGLAVTVDFSQDTSKEEGSVLRQSLSVGAEVRRGDSVTITVNTAKPLVSVPGVIGQSEGAAQAALAGNFAVMVNTAFNDKSPKGTVFDQSLAAGTQQNKGTTIVITVSLGHEYSVVYDANGGSGAPGVTRVAEGGSARVAGGPSGAPQFTVSYDANGGAASGGSSTVAASFQGWGTSPGGGVAYSAGASIPGSGNVTLYAQWSPAKVPSQPSASRDYSIFGGWFTDPSGGSQIAAGASLTSNVTLFAHWADKPLQWAPANQVPAGAQQVAYRWTYTDRITSTNATPPGGYTQWQNPTWNAWGSWIKTTNNPGAASESREVQHMPAVAAQGYTEWRYEHWAYTPRYDNGTLGKRFYIGVSVREGAHYSNWTYTNVVYETKASRTGIPWYKDYPPEEGGPGYLEDGGALWFHRSEHWIVTQAAQAEYWNYRDRTRTYYYQKPGVESPVTSTHTNAPANSVNAVEYIQYREK